MRAGPTDRRNSDPVYHIERELKFEARDFLVQTNYGEHGRYCLE
jgi:hypothetical protein